MLRGSAIGAAASSSSTKGQEDDWFSSTTIVVLSALAVVTLVTPGHPSADDPTSRSSICASSRSASYAVRRPF